MVISQAQLRKDLRLYLAYKSQVRQPAPLGKIGNLSFKVDGSPKARMPGIFERFILFCGAIHRTRKFIGELDAALIGLNADHRRVQKYTGELLGKLQIGFVESARTRSDFDKMLLSIRKTVKKLHHVVMVKHGENKNGALVEEFNRALAAVKTNEHDVAVVKSGLKYLIFHKHASEISRLPDHERILLRYIARAFGFTDVDMSRVLGG